MADATAPRVHVVGFASCPFHQAAAQLARRAHSVATVDVQTLPDAAAFHAWTREHGRPDGTTSPSCSADGEVVGGYTELRTWVAERAEAALGKEDDAEVAILSLQKHAGKRWVVDFRLAFALAGVRARVLGIDDGECPSVWDVGPRGGGLGLATTGHRRSRWRALVNAVSDAAPAHVQRRQLAAMKAAEAAGVLVFNPTGAHTAVAGKVAQHALLHALGLPAPRSAVVSESSSGALARAAADAGLRYPLLLKPNAGGFGDGIVKFSSEADLLGTQANSDRLRRPFGEDGLAVLQEQLTPKEGRVGRIWLLDGEVLCAVRALPMEVGSAGRTSASGCMADGKAAVASVAWDPPAAVKDEVRRISEAAGGKWGSVECLSPQGGQEDLWLYFDLNLSCVSTMPDPALVADPGGLWKDGFDPYLEVARYVLRAMPPRVDADAPHEEGGPGPCKKPRAAAA